MLVAKAQYIQTNRILYILYTSYTLLLESTTGLDVESQRGRVTRHTDIVDRPFALTPVGTTMPSAGRVSGCALLDRVDRRCGRAANESFSMFHRTAPA